MRDIYNHDYNTLRPHLVHPKDTLSSAKATGDTNYDTKRDSF